MSRNTLWIKTDMRGCRPPGTPGGCQRLDLLVYSRTHNGVFQTGHEGHPGEHVPCGVKVELKPNEGRKR